MEDLCVTWHQNGQCPLGWLAETRLADLWPRRAGRTRRGGEVGQALRGSAKCLSNGSFLCRWGQLAREERRRRTCPGKQKTAFSHPARRLVGRSPGLWHMSPLGACSLEGSVWIAESGGKRLFVELFCDEMMIMMLQCRQWESWPAHLQRVCVGEAYPDTCFQLAGLLHVNAS